jgi:hypothetical protein
MKVHEFAWQVVSCAEVAVEILERDSAIAVRHVADCFLDGGNFFSRCLRFGILPSPFIQGFLGRLVDALIA